MDSPARTEVGGQTIRAGTRCTIELNLPGLYTHSPITMPVHVVCGRRDGPGIFVSAAIHGDELNGVEIVRRLLKRPGLKKLRGTLFAIPVVNVYGVIQHSRYLPDGRDLNRSFPGSEKGSLTARLADLFMNEIVAHCSYGIDLHTGASHRANLPQIRAKLDDKETSTLAHAFGVPVLINSDLRDGSLREAAADQGVRMLLYEAGEALRFDEVSIRAGVNGIMNVLRTLGMVSTKSKRKTPPEPFIARSSTWVRAPQSGVLTSAPPLGARVKKNDVIAVIADPFSDLESEVVAHAGGLIIGRTNIPLVHEGDALFHIARFESARDAASQVEAFHADYEDPPDR
ncbi:MAG: succinylglutamate desuccinylase/aspartoacylase family protein [Gammaproteobacteria bacterium]|nr:succinylglutamate desuccinylase/aspartoacylase family protein [Gammaproteobacteria bacterium]